MTGNNRWQNFYDRLSKWQKTRKSIATTEDIFTLTFEPKMTCDMVFKNSIKWHTKSLNFVKFLHTKDIGVLFRHHLDAYQQSAQIVDMHQHFE